MYQTHSSILDVVTEAKLAGLRSKRRTTPSGEIKGGKTIDRGHIYHILTNPIYAGRIRHKKEVFEGKHPPIIDLDAWDEIQSKLALGAGRKRGMLAAAHSSPLVGKLFDESGYRLTPSHSSKNGKRLRYYISHRLVTGKSKECPDAWRLPAPQLEQSIARVIHTICRIRQSCQGCWAKLLPQMWNVYAS